MPNATLASVTTWVFDLDNTLYPPEARLFDLIEANMTAWVMRALGVSAEQADRTRKFYWRKYGTTLAGLMREHDIDPVPYLAEVHDISFDSLTPDPRLAEAVRALPGRKIVYTNGSAGYAGRVVAARGLSGLFERIYGVEDAGFLPKPERAAFEAIINRDGFNPKDAAMFEDDPRNLAEPHGLGMATVHVAPKPFVADHIHHHTSDLAEFLERLV